MKKKILVGVLVAGALGLGLYAYGVAPEGGQGRLFNFSSGNDLKNVEMKDVKQQVPNLQGPNYSMSLAVNSPSGSRAVRSSDNIMKFNLSTKDSFPVNSIKFRIDTNDVDLDSGADFWLKVGGENVEAEVTKEFVNNNVNLTFELENPVRVERNEQTEFALYADTQTLVTQTPNDDLLTPKFKGVNGFYYKNLAGNTLRY